MLGLGAAAFVLGRWVGLSLADALVRLVAGSLVRPETMFISPVSAKDKLDTLASLATISLPVIAVIAGVQTYGQVKEAERTRVASIYLEINLCQRALADGSGAPFQPSEY